MPEIYANTFVKLSFLNNNSREVLGTNNTVIAKHVFPCITLT